MVSPSKLPMIGHVGQVAFSGARPPSIKLRDASTTAQARLARYCGMLKCRQSSATTYIANNYDTSNAFRTQLRPRIRGKT